MNTGFYSFPSIKTAFVGTVLLDRTIGTPDIVDLNNINQSFDHLEIYVTGRADTTDQVLGLVINGDLTATDYFYQYQYASGSTHTQNWGNNVIVGLLTASTDDADCATQNVIRFLNYSKDFNMKIANVKFFGYRTGTTRPCGYIAYLWRKINPITRITLGAGTSILNFATGSRITVVAFGKTPDLGRGL